ncbi:hypothetical protein [Guptibacillus hwajinpoensis]|uniref:hypothetical protein n=1 Tax=Guptibacillus hwajinpoensis TaxID=208199 RepID=UPI001CFF123E|nr:hypothetical protein [Pseudalkalibacillus hwajinpoensis]WLR59054.1 hypothetical protein LC071_18170 [Pseudalkalibacillus hwajinpoensis]
MQTLFHSVKNLFLDLFAMGKGLVYGFLLVGLLTLIVGALIYGFLFLRHLFV